MVWGLITLTVNESKGNAKHAVYLYLTAYTCIACAIVITVHYRLSATWFNNNNIYKYLTNHINLT